MSLASSGKSAATLIVLALAAPIFGVRAWSTAYADRLAVTIASSVSAMVSSASPPPSDRAFADLEAEPTGSAPSSDARGALAAKDSKPRSHARAGGVAHGIRISASQVLALAARRTMPQAEPVKATARHPAGLMLLGVSAMGVGLQDGDVLTEAAGQKATSVATVVGIVLAARGRQVTEISGRFYRGWLPFGLTVEQPYPKQPLPG
ncbi:MAG: hypothetical protein ABIQ16_28350 [Polyangiaceae bacterium]